MHKYLIISCSLSGCTDKIAEIIADHLVSKGNETKIVIPDDVTTNDLSEYQHILIGTWTYTMSTLDKILLPYELDEMMDIVDDSDLSGKRFGVFGSCDSGYNYYGASINLLAETLASFGANVMDKHLEIELYPDTEEKINQCIQFADSFCTYIET